MTGAREMLVSLLFFGKVLVSLLGVSPQYAHYELGLVCGTSIRLEWLHSKFSDTIDVDSDRRISALLELICCTW